MADPQVTQFIGGPRSREMTMDSVAKMHGAFETRGWGTLAVLTKSTRDYIGYCGVRPLTNTTDVEVAFAIKSSTWGNGFATEAATAAIDNAFNHLPIQRILATVYHQNSACIRVLTKLGMTLTRHVFGVWPHDLALLYSLERRTN
jgi:RimJ/RimL family protein N-acetyltransferase